MRALVVYESMFGNTEVIALAIADGLRSQMDVETVDVASAPTWIPRDLDLLVVGGPTHAFGMSRPQTREAAAKEAGHTVTSQAVGLREWLAGLEQVAADNAPAAVVAATFDTRVERPRMPGSAAHKLRRRLRRLGIEVVEPATTFWVKGTPGPLVDGEETRARRWGEDLASIVTGIPGLLV